MIERAAIFIATIGWVMPPASLESQQPEVRERDSGTTALLQAVSAPSESVVWVSGHEGAVLKSEDGGETWARRPVQTSDSLEFRDIHAFDADVAIILSAGTGPQSRIYRTTDGGDTWSLSWLNEEPEGFYDCLDFWDDQRGLVYGDAVDGGLRVRLTRDGGVSWDAVPPEQLPAPAGSEGGFAASGTCVQTGPDGLAWIATGAGDRPRILRTDDYGSSWDAVDLPLVAGEAAGAVTVAFWNADRGLVLGGDLGQAEEYTDNVARSSDGGRSWTLQTHPPFVGAVYGSALLRDPARLLAVGPAGLALTSDEATAWALLDDRSFWAVGAAGKTAWAVGPDGRILELRWND